VISETIVNVCHTEYLPILFLVKTSAQRWNRVETFDPIRRCNT